MGLFSDFFNLVQFGVNSSMGNNYRNIYFEHYPDRYHTCKGCFILLDREVPYEVTIDHIIPQKCYGTNAITNLQVLCQPCNSRKKRPLHNSLCKGSWSIYEVNATKIQE